MRAVVQRVTHAAVAVDGAEVARIGPGLLVLLGVGQGDTEVDADFLARKILNLRIFEDDAGKMNLSALQLGLELLVVSQFTLYGDCRKGNRPDFTAAGAPDRAEMLYERFAEVCRRDAPVATGRFGAHMKVTLLNDGPVTLILESTGGAI
jgi:D-aminoacyl-tRNA deacylase